MANRAGSPLTELPDSAASPRPEVPGAPRTLVLADEPELWREGLAALCERTGRYRVSGTCGAGAPALDLLASGADLALIGDGPGLPAAQLIDQARARGCSTRFVVLSDRRDRRTVLDALRAGANGFVLRGGPAAEIFDALRQAEQGAIFLSPLVDPEDLFVSAQVDHPDPLARLTAREYQVLTLLADGVRPKEIAGRLDLSAKTVDSHRKNLMRKLELKDIAGLVRFAIRRKLVTG